MDIAAVITGHAEGDWLAKAMESARINGELLPKGVSFSIHVYLDSADSLTLSRAREFEKVQVVEVEFADICKVRNLAVEQISSDYIAFLDGDDLWCDDWLLRCIEFYKSQIESECMVLHPQLTYCFGTQGIESQIVMEHIDSKDDRFDPFNLVSSNYWSALAFAPRSLFQKFPYVSSSEFLGLGFEDWTFNIQTLSSGIRHAVVPETVHFIRRKDSGSRGAEENARKATFKPTFDWRNFL